MIENDLTIKKEQITKTLNNMSLTIMLKKIDETQNNTSSSRTTETNLC